MSTCPHGKPIGAKCLVCLAEAVQAGVKALRAPLDYNTGPEVWTDAQAYVGFVDNVIRRGGARALAIVALRRIVDRAVSDEVSSLATTDILRIALKALSQLED